MVLFQPRGDPPGTVGPIDSEVEAEGLPSLRIRTGIGSAGEMVDGGRSYWNGISIKGQFGYDGSRREIRPLVGRGE